MDCERAEEVSPILMNVGFILMAYSKKTLPIPFSYNGPKICRANNKLLNVALKIC